MKKVLVILTLSAILITSLQIACSKSEAQTPTTSSGAITQVGKIVFSRGQKIWICNYDGTGLTQLNIVLPQGIGFSDGVDPIVSPDGRKIFFTAGAQAGTSTDYYSDLYSCNIDGSSVTKIVDRAGSFIQLGQAF